MLTLTRRGKYWHARGTVAGRFIRTSTRQTDRGRAEEVAAQISAAEHKRALYGPESITTFAMAVEAYLADGRSPRFVLALLDRWKNRLISAITPGEIRATARALYPAVCPATWNRQVITPAQAIINHAHDRGWCPPIRVKRFPSPSPERQAVDRAWIDAFRGACRKTGGGRYLAALALFMFQTGARIGEAVALMPDDIHLGNRAASIYMSKTGKVRTAALTLEMVVELANLPARNGRVFGYQHRWSVYKPWSNTCRRAGIDQIPPHQAGRHSFATAMVQAGIDPATAAGAGGFSPAVMLGTYAHSGDQRVAIDEVFGTKLAQPRHGKHSKH